MNILILVHVCITGYETDWHFVGDSVNILILVHVCITGYETDWHFAVDSVNKFRIYSLPRL